MDGRSCSDDILTTPTDERLDHAPKMEGEPVPIEFAGWIPVTQRFGFCGSHPQFAHTDDAPEGYRFVRSGELEVPWLRHTRRKPNMILHGIHIGKQKTVQLLGSLIALVLWPMSKSLAMLGNLVSRGPSQVAFTLMSAARLWMSLVKGGAHWLPALRFVHSRHFVSQLLLPRHPKLLFLTSVPYTYGQHPWIIEIEDATTLFFPFVHNGQTAELRIEDSAYFPILKTVLEADNCRGILTHVQSTADALVRMFDSDVIARKVFHVPMGVRLPVPARSTPADDELIHMLFSCSWHQDPRSFYLRGGLEVLEAFAILHERYPQVRLTLRTGLPYLNMDQVRLLEKSWVRVISRFLENDEMDSLMAQTDIFLVPAARIHIVSVLKAMAYGQVVVASDGWGFDEYIQDGHNGILVPGRLNKVSWTDPENGMLREDYTSMSKPDPLIVEGLVNALSTLIEDHELRRRLGRQARHDVRTRFNLDNWNHGLKQALDRALGERSVRTPGASAA